MTDRGHARESSIDPIEALTRGSSAPDEPRALDALRQRLAARAEVDGLLDVGYWKVDSPFGSLLLAATPIGVVRVAFEVQDHDAVLASLASDVSARVLRAPRRLDSLAHQLDEYFAGRRRALDLPVDWRLAAGFRREALAVVASIEPGRTMSYADVAIATSHEGAARAVGTACRLNPVPLLVPCHRVVRADGTPGHYAGGDAVKRALLRLESAG